MMERTKEWFHRNLFRSILLNIRFYPNNQPNDNPQKESKPSIRIPLVAFNDLFWLNKNVCYYYYDTGYYEEWQHANELIKRFWTTDQIQYFFFRANVNKSKINVYVMHCMCVFCIGKKFFLLNFIRILDIDGEKNAIDFELFLFRKSMFKSL